MAATGSLLPQLLLLAALLVSLFTSTTMNPVKRHMNHKEVCGRHLAEALRRTCVSYHTHFSADLQAVDINGSSGRWSHAEDKGIVDECCYKRCNFSQLSQYCAVSKDLSFAEQSRVVDMNSLTDDESSASVPDVEVTEPPPEPEVTYIDFEEGPLILIPVHTAPNFASYVYDSVDRIFQ